MLHDPGGKDVFGVAFSSNTRPATGQPRPHHLVERGQRKRLATLSDRTARASTAFAF